jgi:hypothetical protein
MCLCQVRVRWKMYLGSVGLRIGHLVFIAPLNGKNSEELARKHVVGSLGQVLYNR